MANSSSNNEARSQRGKLWLLLLSRPVLGTLIVLLAGLAGLGGWLWVYLQNELAPTIETNLSQLLNRPVKLGKLEQITFTSLRFDRTTIPPFSQQVGGQTIREQDSAMAAAVEVNFNPWDLLWSRSLNLAVSLKQPQLNLVQDKEGRWLRTQLQPLKPSGWFTTNLQSIQVQQAQITALPYGANPRQLTGVQGNVLLADQGQRLRFDLQGQVVQGGDLKLDGEWRNPAQDLKLTLRTRNLAATVVNNLFPEQKVAPVVGGPPVDVVQIQRGQVDSNLRLYLRQGELPQVEGTAQVRDLALKLVNVPQSLQRLEGQVRLQGLTAVLEQGKGFFGDIPLKGVRGTIDQRGFNLSGQIPPVEVNRSLKTLALKLTVPVAGKVQVPDLQLMGTFANPRLLGTIASVGTSKIDRLDFRKISARFGWQGERLIVQNIQAIPSVGGILRGQAGQRQDQLAAELVAEGIPAAAIARLYGNELNFDPGAVSAQIQVGGALNNLKTLVQFDAPQSTYPTRGVVLISNNQILLRNLVTQVTGGVITAEGQIQAGQWQLSAASTGVPLRQFNADLRGFLSGRVNLAGSLDRLDPAHIIAAGQINLDQGLAGLNQPIAALVRWNGRQVEIVRAESAGLLAAGTIATQWSAGASVPQIGAIDLQLFGQGLDLGQLALPGAAMAIRTTGKVDLRGRLQGTLANLDFAGQMRTRNLAINQLGFESQLAGTVAYTTTAGLALNLVGGRDQLRLNLASNGQPQSFLVRRQEAIAVGQRSGENLQVQVQRFPLKALNLRPDPAVDRIISGLASGQFSLNLNTQALQGQIAVLKPGLGNLFGDRLVANVQYNQGIATLRDGEFSKGKSQYLLNARLVTGADPQLSGRIRVVAGELQDVITALQTLNPTALGEQPPVYAKAADVRPLPVGLPDAPLLTQLRRFSEIQALAEEAARKPKSSTLPGLNELQGPFGGQIDFAGSAKKGLEANFDFQGQQISWGKNTFSQAVARGRVQAGRVNLDNFQIASGEGQARFSGVIGGNEQKGQLLVQNLSMDTVRRFVDLPNLDLQGNLDAQMQLGGSFTNPQAEGSLQLNQAKLNAQTLQAARADFNYSNARLDFNSSARLEDQQPILITGSLPYQLPFARQAPQSDRLKLDLQVKNGGLSLLNLFTDQVTWLAGSGSVDLKVRGSLKQPKVEGLVSLNQVSLKPQALTAPLTDLTGTLRFDRDQLFVDNLQGKFREGIILAKGSLPLNESASQNPETASEASLQVNFNQLNLKVPNLYTGEANGNLGVGGSLFSPELTGTIQLSNGQILLEETEPAAPLLPGQDPVSTASSPFEPLELNNLQVALGENVQITRAPLLTFIGTGKISIDGTIDNPQPQGEVQFQRGQVNLFTSRFQIDSSQANFARFIPSQGLDPNLDLNLITTVTEVSGGRLNPSSEFETLPLPSLGNLTSVRVTARVVGRASQLETNFRNVVELSSSPARSEGEILALLGGGLNVAQDQQNPTLALANLASSAFLNRLQGIIDNYLGTRVTFRLFPALIPVDPKAPNTGSNSILGLGAEVGYDLTDRFSVSALQVLTAPGDPTRFNFGYQLNDNLRLSTSVNLAGDAVGLFEYRIRF